MLKSRREANQLQHLHNKHRPRDSELGQNISEEFIADITVLFGYMDIINLNTKNYVIAMKIIFTRFINKDRVYIFAHNF
jgi:hypothetical protein